MYTVVLVAGIGHPECSAHTGVNRDLNTAVQMAVLAYNNASENTGADVLEVSDFESLCELPGMQAPNAWGAVHVHSSWSETDWVYDDDVGSYVARADWHPK